MLQRCLFLILMLETLLVNTAVDRTHRDRDVVIVSSCVELRRALIADDLKTRIKLTQNLNCSATEWGTPVSVIGDRVLEGLKPEDELLSIHLDLSSIKHGIVLSEQQSLSFRSLVLHTDQEGSSMESMLSSVLLQGEESVVYISGSVIMSHSCRKSQNRVLYFSSSQLNDATTVDDESRVLSGTFKRLHVCQCRLCCFTGEDTPVAYGLSENQKSESNCSRNERTVQMASLASSKSGGRNQRRRVISLTLVCVFSVLFVILVLILWRRLSTDKLNDKDPSGAQKEESRLSVERTPIGLTEEGGGVPPYIVKLGDISIDTSQELGTGGFGVVYEGTYKDEIAAIKVIRLQEAESDGDKESRISEALVHPNVVQMYGTQTVKAREIFGDYRANGDEVCKVIAMEYCDKGELSRAIDKGEYVLSFDSLRPNMSAILYSALDIAKGLEYLHSQGIVHGDLKPDNVLRKSVELDPRRCICKICDFGLSRKVGDILAETDTLGMISYMPPELLRQGYVGRFTDIYSFGMLLWELATSDVPFAEVDFNQIVLETVNGRRPQIPDSTPSTLLNLINSCWDSDYEVRPSASRVIEQLNKAISEWYSEFPTCSITIPSKKEEESCNDGNSLPDPFLTQSFERLHDLDRKSEWSTKHRSHHKNRRRRMKARSYYEVHKQVLLASAPSVVCSPKETHSITPFTNEDVLIPPLFPSRYPFESLLHSCGSSSKKSSPSQEASTPLEGKKPKRSGSSKDLGILVPDFTPRSMLARLSDSLKGNQCPSASSSAAIDRNFSSYECGLFSSRNIESEASIHNSRMQDFEEV